MQTLVLRSVNPMMMPVERTGMVLGDIAPITHLGLLVADCQNSSDCLSRPMSANYRRNHPSALDVSFGDSPPAVSDAEGTEYHQNKRGIDIVSFNCSS